MGIMGRTPQQSVGPASEALAGYVQLASVAEALAGTNQTKAVTPEGLQGAVDVIGNQTVKAQFFATISAGTTTGTISKPASGGADVAFVMDEWGTDTDALLSTLDNGKPTFSTPTTVAGVAITTTFNTAGEFTFSGTPSPAADIALIYVYTCYLTNLNPAEVLFESELISHSHSLLSNLDADDHAQYHNDTRGDVRYYTKTQLGATASGASGADLIGIPTIAGATNTNLQEYIHLFGSAGRSTGGAVTDAGGETVNVAAGTGFIKATDDDTAELLSFNWAAVTAQAIATNTVRYVGVEYNSGSPQVTIRTTDNFDLDTDFPLAKVVNDGGSLHILNNPWWVTDGITNIIERFQAEGHLVRDEHVGGLIISVPGTRNLAVTGGTLWSRLNELPISALDTNVTGTFEYYYYSTDGGWASTDNTQYSVTNYNDVTKTAGNELVALNNNWYANLWVYVEADDNEIAVLYPQNQYANAASAEVEAPPTLISTHHSESSMLIGRILIKQGVDAPVEVQTVFDTTFNTALAADHGNLAGLADDDHTQYVLTTGVRAMGELRLTPKASSDSAVEGTMFYCSDDDHIYVGTE